MTTAIAPIPAPTASANVYQQSDFEVDDILNEIGIFADEYMPLIDHNYQGGASTSTSTSMVHNPMMSMASAPESESAPSSFVPVSPDHIDEASVSSSVQEETHSVSPAEPVITPSTSMEKVTTFSVPNPFADMDFATIDTPLAPAPVAAPKAAVQEIPTFKIEQEQAQTVVAETEPAPQEISTRNNKKRKLFSTIATTTTSIIKDDPKNQELTEGQMLERRQRNREHAKRSRMRKKSLTGSIQQSVEDLKAENLKLRTQVYAIIGQRKAERIMKTRKIRARERFTAGVMDPKNRILDDSTVAFLKSLQKNCD
jgi:hypothetical protein